MSASQYKKLLSVAETILSKIDLPQETFDKYNEFKDRILEEGSTEPTELVTELQADIIGVYQQFFKAVLDMLGQAAYSKKSGENLEQRLNSFVEQFNRKKKTIREAADSGMQKYSIEGKVSIQRIVDSLDDMEIDFDKLVGNIGVVSDMIREKDVHISSLSENFEIIQNELQESREHIKENDIFSLEIRALSEENLKVQERLKEKDSLVQSLSKETETLQRTMGLKIDSLEHSQRQALRTTQEYERSFERLLGFFKSHVSKQNMEILKSRNLPAILDYIEDFVEVTIKHNYQLTEDLRDKEESINELQSHVSESDKITSTNMDDIRKLIAESNSCMHDLDNHVSSLHRMRTSFSSAHQSFN